jgi:ABC-type transport system involved in multi-copper enzyme maturation permease subunit
LFGSGIVVDELVIERRDLEAGVLPCLRVPDDGGVLRADLRRITTTKLWWVALICIFVLSAGYAALPATVAWLQGRAGVASSPFTDPGIIRSIYNGGNVLSRILAMVVGIVAIGSEYRYGTLAASYLATPRRVRMLLGKAGALLIFGVIYGIVSVAAGILVAIPFVLANNGSLLLDQPATWRSIILGVCSIALWTMIGMGIGILIKNMLVALLVGIILGFLVEPIVSVLFFVKRWDQLLNLMPTGATNAMLQITSPVLFAAQHPTPWWLAGLILAAWCLLPVIAGMLSAVRRDVA